MISKSHIPYFAMTLVMAFATGCSSTDESNAKTGPVDSSPLAGSVAGTSFTAKSAIARAGFKDGRKELDIYDIDVTCKDFAPTADRYVLLSVPWQAGTARDFSIGTGDSAQTATFVIQKDGATTNVFSTQGRVEVLEAPSDVGSKGKIRLRAIADENHVEGEIAVDVCE